MTNRELLLMVGRDVEQGSEWDTRWERSEALSTACSHCNLFLCTKYSGYFCSMGIASFLFGSELCQGQTAEVSLS